MKQFLYHHNLKAYEAVKAHYEKGHRKACIVHATGTGKSYIIAALASDYKRVLVVAPNDYVLAQVQKNVGEEAEYVTYAKLMFEARYGQIETNQYDLIVLDEYHRAGAELWSEGVKAIIAANPDALLFGTTATDIRYLDGQRNMSEELFDGHVVSNLSVGEAWARKILLSPVYVCAAEGMDATYHTYKKKIESTDMTDEERKSLKKSLAAIREDWENIGGVPSILQKHLPQDVSRIIIFCPDIYSTNRYRKLVQEWLGKAGIQIHRTYIIESKRNPSENMKEMEHFQEDGFDGVKVMISVNMLNEGIHVPRVDAVIMLRNTVSGNIYLQQLGRCMHTGVTNHRPVVFDLVNNITSAFTHDTFAFERAAYNEALEDLTDEEKERGAGHFIEVVDYLMDTRELLEKMDDRMVYMRYCTNWLDNYKIAKEFYDKHGRFPTNADITGIKTYFVKWERGCGKRNPEMLSQLYAIGYEKRDTEQVNSKNLEACKSFYAEHGELPSVKDNKQLRTWIRSIMKYKNHKDIMEELLQMGYRRMVRCNNLWEQKYEVCKAYYEKYGCFPPSSGDNIEASKARAWIANWVNKKGDDYPEQMQLLENIGFERRYKSFEDMFKVAEEMYKKNGHFPTIVENRTLWYWFYNYMNKKDKDPENVKRLMAIGYGANSRNEKWNANYLEAKKFYLKNGHFPTLSEYKSLYVWATGVWYRASTSEEQKKKLREIGFPRNELEEKWTENYLEAKELFEQNGHFPRYCENERLWRWAKTWCINSSSNNPEKLKMLEEIGFDGSKYKSKKK